jgi:multidrug efflux system outer membrane protein
MIKFHWPLLAALVLLSGCVNLAPQYQRPEAPVAGQWLPSTSVASGDSAADIHWQQFFTDSRLARLQTLALTNNRDLRLASLNIEKAQAQYRIQRAAAFPTIDAGVSGTHSRTSSSGTASTSHEYSAQLGLSSYELDVFGRVQNLQDEALEDYLALTETRRSTQISLVAEVATAWLTLAADNERLQLAQETLRSQQATYELNQRSHALGGSSGLALAQAQTTVESARGDVAVYASQILQDHNALRLLVGSDIPDELLPGASLQSVALLVQVPDELPSSLLQRRPDVLAAEHTLKSANVSLPIFDAGSNRATLDAAKVEREIQVQTYQQTLQTAFKEVADALAVRSTLDQRLTAQQALTDASRKSFELADALYRGGSQSYLEALDAQRSLYSAQQDLITLRLAEQSNRVTLYKVMGGGWN